MLNFASVLHPHLVYSIEVDANTFHGSLTDQPTNDISSLMILLNLFKCKKNSSNNPSKTGINNKFGLCFTQHNFRHYVE